MEHRHTNIKQGQWNAAVVHSIWERGSEEDICALISAVRKNPKKSWIFLTVDVLKDFNSYYLDLIRGQKALPIVQPVRQLAEPKPGDLVQVDLSQYKGNRPPYDSWEYIENICGEISVALADLL